ncbi:MAG TPA: NAD(P)/FAD-dependent oxidoreductase [Terriglobales bacterium]|nr:NAD(P)/FAD-dependent oxidoreductase [Terriglobales bacterium]
MGDVVLVIGGGPAGALAAERLAAAGRSVTLFDEKLAWEKPCGGGLTDKALRRYPFLREACRQHLLAECELIGRDGRSVTLRLDRPIAVMPRLQLNGLLLDRARQAGAELIRDRVVALDRDAAQGWRFKTAAGAAGRADFAVIAAGARNPFRAAFAPQLTSADFMTALGYYVPGTSPRLQVKFEPDLDGYIWTFPRRDHISAGICGAVPEGGNGALRRRLESWLAAAGLSIRDSRFYAHLLPAPRLETLRHLRFAGPGWALAGDAAGLVDPITGEGLYYALRSGELLAEALLANRPERYEAALRSDFVPELEWAARIAPRFYRGRFLGATVIDRMLGFTAASRRFQALMRDLFAGSQGYLGLKRRLYRQLLPTLAEVLVAR